MPSTGPALRNDRVGDVFRVQAAILEHFRDYLTSQRFTEIISSKIVASGTEGGTNLFEIKYFERAAYLAQSPQFYKEHGVAGFERVFETGHVYRAEPHATSRHLTEYYSLDFEMGFIDGPEDVIQLERELLTHIFDSLTPRRIGSAGTDPRPLPSMLDVPIWTFPTASSAWGGRTPSTISTPKPSDSSAGSPSRARRRRGLRVGFPAGRAALLYPPARHERRGFRPSLQWARDHDRRTTPPPP